MKRGLSQEGLKLIACVSMLLDHIGAILLPQVQWLRVIGRMAFPVYCFLLVEGIHRSKNLKKYQDRLILAALLAEVPYDLAVSGGVDFARCSVMVTLLLGFWVVRLIQQRGSLWKRVAIIPLMLLSEILWSDYGSIGILIILLFEVTRNGNRWLLLLGMVALNWSGASFHGIPIQLFAVLALIPIWLYDGRKLTRSKWVQWGFYLFYPVHLLVLTLI